MEPLSYLRQEPAKENGGLSWSLIRFLQVALLSFRQAFGFAKESLEMSLWEKTKES